MYYYSDSYVVKYKVSYVILTYFVLLNNVFYFVNFMYNNSSFICIKYLF